MALSEFTEVKVTLEVNCALFLPAFPEPWQRQPEHGADPRPLQLHLEPRDGRLRLHRRQPAAQAQRRRANRLGGVYRDRRQQGDACGTFSAICFDYLLLSMIYPSSQMEFQHDLLDGQGVA